MRRRTMVTGQRRGEREAPKESDEEMTPVFNWLKRLIKKVYKRSACRKLNKRSQGINDVK